MLQTLPSKAPDAVNRSLVITVLVVAIVVISAFQATVAMSGDNGKFNSSNLSGGKLAGRPQTNFRQPESPEVNGIVKAV